MLTVLTIVAGTMLLMWIGDQITERGIGNGISLIITVNIISALPGALVQAWKYYRHRRRREPVQRADPDGRADRASCCS